MAIKVDTTALKKSMLKLRVVDDYVKPALFNVGSDILGDALEIEPKPPIEFGDLRGSGEIDVEDLVVKVRFNTSYALRLHEGTDWNPREHKQAPGEASKSGPFWLSSKLDLFSERYKKSFSKYINKQIKKRLK